MNSSRIVLVLVLGALGGAAVLLRPLERHVRDSVPTSMVRPDQFSGLAGRGSLLAVLGGLRSVVAGGFWLKTNLAWERSDESATLELIELTVAADERPLYFWLNGARMIAYDMPEWGADAAARPEAVRRKIGREHAERALALLEKGLRWHGPRVELYVEMANIQLRRLGNAEEAARCYRLAAELPDAPYYAARIYAELLVGLGREAEALAWLERQLVTLPANDPAARREVVVERIQWLKVRVGEK